MNLTRPIRVSLAISFASCFASLLPAQEPSAKAILIDVASYRDATSFDPLPGTERDMEDLAKALGAGGYEVTRLSRSVPRESDEYERLNPTADNLRARLREIVLDPCLEESDRVVVALSGHGVTLDALEAGDTGPPRKVRKFFFCPHDADLAGYKATLEAGQTPTLKEASLQFNLLPVDDVLESLRGESCKAGLKLLIVDSCRNDPTAPATTRDASLTRPKVPPTPAGVLALYSCGEGQKAVETDQLDGLRRGVFFHFLTKGLSGEADFDKDGQIMPDELTLFAGMQTRKYVLAKHSRLQEPFVVRSGPVAAVVLDLPRIASAEMKVGPVGRDDLKPRPAPQLSDFKGTKAGEVRTLVADPKIEFCWCPAGSFKMGSPDSDPDAFEEEQPQVDVTLAGAFWLAKTELTQGQWMVVMNTEPWKDWYLDDYRVGSDYPAICVSWEDAAAYCTKLTEREHQADRLPANWEYCLPTEAQWEYACRAGTTTRFSFGDDAARLEDYAWHVANAKDVGEQYAHRVGLKLANPWGILDIHGNVFEWCRDAQNTYPGKIHALRGGQDPYNATGSGRVCRGGCWNGSASGCRSANRFVSYTSERHSAQGFRLACVPSE